MTHCHENGSRSSAGLFVKDNQNDLSVFESLFSKIGSLSKSSIRVIYGPNTASKAGINMFLSTLQDVMDIINNKLFYA